MADAKIKTKNPGILEVPENKKFWQLPLSHYEKLVDKKGYTKIIRALTNLEVWNKNDDPKISKKASDIADKLKKKYKKEARLVETDKSIYISNNKSPIRTFLELHKDLIEESPKDYKGDRDIEEVLFYLGSTDGVKAKIQTPIEQIIFNENNLNHLLFQNNSERLLDLNKIIETLKNPNLIIETNENHIKHNYIKAFSNQNIANCQLVVIKIADDRNFYVTSFRLKDFKFINKLLTGEIIYDLLDEITNKINEDFYKKSYTQQKSVGEWDIDINFAYNNNSSVQAENMDSLVEWKQKNSGITYTDYTGKKLFFNDLNDILYIIKDFPINEFRESINQILKDTEKYYPAYNNKYRRKIGQKYKKEALTRQEVNKYSIDEYSELVPFEFKLKNTTFNGYMIDDLYIFTVEDWHKMCDITADVIAFKLGDTFGKLFDRETAAELMKDDPVSFEAGLTLIENLDENEDFLYKFNKIEDTIIANDGEEYLILKED